MNGDPKTLDRLKSLAQATIREEIDPALDCELKLEKLFDRHPFSENITAAAFSFRPVPGSPRTLYVFAGDVMPMIYPDLALPIDEMWAVHIGTEYFIKMEVMEEKERDPRRMFAYLKMVSAAFTEQLFITLTAPPKIEKIYRLQDRRQVIGYYTHDNKEYTWIVGDVPHFIYRRRLPPQIAWALHMGKLLLSA